MKLKNIILLMILFLAPLWARAESETEQPLPVSVSVKYELVDSITKGYYDWQTISMSGKLSSPMLPLTASVKVFMEKGKLLIITISAPLIGEAARIEIDSDCALVVNKLKNAYATVEMEDLEPVCPGGLDAIQNLLLGRVTILGDGELKASDCSSLDIYSAGDDTWMLLPVQDIEHSPFVYFYTFGKNPLELQRFAVLSQDGASELDCYYVAGSKNTTLDFMTLINGKTMEATLQLNNPDNQVRSISRFELSSKFKKTDLKGLLK